MPHPMETLAHGDAVLQEKAADLIDDRGPLANQAVAHAMQRLKIELLVRLCRDAPSRGTLHGFSDRMRIAEVVLVGLPEGLARCRRYSSRDGSLAADAPVRGRPQRDGVG